jgi:hypothetical protein
MVWFSTAPSAHHAIADHFWHPNNNSTNGVVIRRTINIVVSPCTPPRDVKPGISREQ